MLGKRYRQPDAPAEESKDKPTKRKKTSPTSDEEIKVPNNTTASTQQVKPPPKAKKPKKPQTAVKLQNLVIKGIETIRLLDKDIDVATRDAKNCEKELQALQQRYDESNIFSAAEKQKKAKKEAVLEYKEKIEKDLRDKKSAYETRIMKRDKDITELKLAAGDGQAKLR